MLQNKPETSNHLQLNFKPQQFLDQYWQKQPLLIKGALADSDKIISKQQLLKLSLDPDVESRLLLEHGPEHDWQTFHGPQDIKQLRALENQQHWTLLVQSVNLWLESCRELLQQFDFIPQWRLDDIMISFGTEHASVGAHIDQYDVFLLQLSGERRWKVGKPDAAVRAISELTDIQQIHSFPAIIDEVLSAGDMLYVPANTAHHGVNLSSGMTLSVGFRSPALSEMMMLFAEQVMLDCNESYYRDPALSIANPSSEITSTSMTKAVNWMSDTQDYENLKRRAFGLLQTQPKQDLLYQPPLETISEFFSNGFLLKRDPAARVAWYQLDESKLWLFINGEFFERPLANKELIITFSELKEINSESFKQQIDDNFIILLEIFVEAGLFGIE